METCAECTADIDLESDAWTCYAGAYVCKSCEASETPNENCLDGMQCPACRSYEPFRIAVTVTVLMYDEGSEDDKMGGDMDWDGESYCECHECGKIGRVKDFTTATKGA